MSSLKCRENSWSVSLDAVLFYGFLFVVPRVLFEGWSVTDFHIIFSSEEAMNGLVETLVSYCKVSNYYLVLDFCINL